MTSNNIIFGSNKLDRFSTRSCVEIPAVIFEPPKSCSNWANRKPLFFWITQCSWIQYIWTGQHHRFKIPISRPCFYSIASYAHIFCVCMICQSHGFSFQQILKISVWPLLLLDFIEFSMSITAKHIRRMPFFIEFSDLKHKMLIRNSFVVAKIGKPIMNPLQ